ncbi:MAG: type VI secretion system ImpA family N-terminal domain-containing protein, partial [Gammaproteobacteria bacterium]
MTECEALLAKWITPITESQPTGRNLREDGSPLAPYHQLRDARALARNAERAALAEGEVVYFALETWQTVYDLCAELLEQQSKDMEVVAWLIESLIRLRGFQGFAVGFSTATALINRYGVALHPQPDEEGLMTQLGPLLGLCGFGSDGPLVSPLKSLPLTEVVDTGALATWQCEQIFEVDRMSDSKKKAARLAQGVATREVLDKTVAASSDAFLLARETELIAAIDAFDQFQSVVAHYADADTQPTRKLAECLDACRQMLTYIAGERLVKFKSDAPNQCETESNHCAHTDGSESDTTHELMEIKSVKQLVIRDRQMALSLL